MSEHHDQPAEEIDADTSGHLATALFAGVIVILLLVIYGLAMAA